MTITANLADGRKLNFPDGTDPAVIQQTVKRLISKQGGQDVNVPSSGVGLPSASSIPTEKSKQVEPSFFDNVSEFFTGSKQETEQTRTIPELADSGLLSGESLARATAIAPSLLTTTDPVEMANILKSNFDNIGIVQDRKGNIIAANNKTGAKAILNKPGTSQTDLLQGLGLASLFSPASAVTGAIKLAGAAGVTSAANEALQELSGGDFDLSQVAIDTVTAGLLDKAFQVAKATGKSIRDVFKTETNIDPDTLLKTFQRQPQAQKSPFSKATEPKESVGVVAERASQPDLTPEAIDRLRRAESQGIQLSKAEATQQFGSSEAEQTLLKSVSPEGEAARTFKDEQQVQLKEAAQKFTDQFGGSAKLSEALGDTPVITAREKGEQIQSALVTTQKLGREEVSNLYTEAAETAGDAIDLNNASIVEVADEIIVNRPITTEVEKSINTALAKFGLIGDSVKQSTRNKFKVMDGDQAILITGEQTPLTLQNAEEFRKALNKAVAADQTGSAKQVIGELDNQVLKVIEEGAEIGRVSAFKTAREAARKQAQTFKAKDIIQDLVGFKKGTSTPVVDPESVITKIAKGEKSVTNIRKIKTILLENGTPQTKLAWKSIKAEAVGDILGQAINKDTLQISGARLNSAIKKYKPEALRQLLGKSGFSELKKLQAVIGDATIPPPGTTNPSGTFNRLLNISERLGNVVGLGQFNFGSIAVETVKKGKELATRKETLNQITNTNLVKLKKANTKMNESQLKKAAKILSFLQIREQDKGDEQ